MGEVCGEEGAGVSDVRLGSTSEAKNKKGTDVFKNFPCQCLPMLFILTLVYVTSWANT